MKTIIASLLLLSIFSPAFVSAQDLPENTEEAQELLEKTLEVGEKELPGIVEKTWKEDVLPIWNKMFSWCKVHVFPIFTNWFNREVRPELEERTEEMIQEELEKERQELKEDIPKATKSMWDKFLEIIR